jgi:hypothetical protein
MGVASTGGCTSLLGDFSSGSSETTDGGHSGNGNDAGPSGPDASVTGDDAGSPPPPGTIAVTASDMAVYVGQIASITASATPSASAFTWTVTGVPASSAVTTASLTGAMTATASFVPDAPGVYVLHAAATAASAMGSQDVHVTAATATVFYGRYEVPTTGPADAALQAAESYYAAGTDGTNARAVTCPTTVADQYDVYRAGNAFDSWEPAPGQPYKFAAFYPIVGDGGSGQVQLVFGTSDSTCTTPPVTIGTFDSTTAGLQPSFSPDGSRIAFYDDAQNIVTIGSDGNDKHPVAAYFGSEPDGATPVYDVGADYVQTAPRVQWTAKGQLAWARSTASGWQIMTAPDQISATATVYMTCLGVTPHQFKMLSDGTVIVAYRPDGPNGAENIFQLKLDASNDCAVVHQYTSLGLSDAGVAGYATDFSVSPDEKQIAYAAIDATTDSLDPWQNGDYPGGYLYVVPVDGSKAPARVNNDPSFYGPRWVAGGSALAYTRVDTNPYQTTQQFGNLIRIINHPPSASVRVVAFGGNGAARIIDHGDGTQVAVSTSGNGGSCSMGRGSASGIAGLFSLLGLACVVRRRRR